MFIAMGGPTGPQGPQGPQGPEGPIGPIGPYEYIDRGDPCVEDFTNATFTKDGAWHDLNLSNIIPTGVTAVLLRVNAKVNTAQLKTYFRKKGNTNQINAAIRYWELLGYYLYWDCWVKPDSNRIIEYKFDSGTWLDVNVSVRAWIV